MNVPPATVVAAGLLPVTNCACPLPELYAPTFTVPAFIVNIPLLVIVVVPPPVAFVATALIVGAATSMINPAVDEITVPGLFPQGVIVDALFISNVPLVSVSVFDVVAVAIEKTELTVSILVATVPIFKVRVLKVKLPEPVIVALPFPVKVVLQFDVPCKLIVPLLFITLPVPFMVRTWVAAVEPVRIEELEATVIEPIVSVLAVPLLPIVNVLFAGVIGPNPPPAAWVVPLLLLEALFMKRLVTVIFPSSVILELIYKLGIVPTEEGAVVAAAH